MKLNFTATPSEISLIIKRSRKARILWLIFFTCSHWNEWQIISAARLIDTRDKESTVQAGVNLGSMGDLAHLGVADWACQTWVKLQLDNAELKKLSGRSNSIIRSDGSECHFITQLFPLPSPAFPCFPPTGRAFPTLALPVALDAAP